MIVALSHPGRDVFVSRSLPDTAPLTRARVEVTRYLPEARRFDDPAALHAYLDARHEPREGWLPMEVP